HLVALLILSEVPGRGHDDDAGPRSALHRAAHRIVDVRIDRGGRQRQIDDLDVVDVPEPDRHIDGGHDAADVSVASLIQDLEIDQACAWRHAGIVATGRVRGAAVSGDDAGDVRAVPVGV